jgi:DNA recombination protein RmuC
MMGGGMDAISTLAGVSVGAALAWLAGARRARAFAERAAAAEERSRAEAERREEAERRLGLAEAARAESEGRISVADEQARQARAFLAEERAFVETARARMESVFKAAAADALKGNNDQFLSLAAQRLETTKREAAADVDARKAAIEALLSPLKTTLERLEEKTSSLEQARAQAYAKIDEQVRSLATAAAGIQRETVTLSTALKGSQVRGRWGEVALRNVVELSGMSQHVDFAEQETIGDGKRPDMVVRLPGTRRIAVDSKATTEFYLEAVAASCEAEREAALDRHAAAVRARVRDLAARDYAARLDGGVDLVVLFLPGEPYLAAAFARDPDLLADALKHRVLVTTPTTLVALLRTVAIYHQQEAVARDAAQIAEAATTLYERGVKFADHLGRVGKGLSTALQAYNEAVGSFETRFLPAGREVERLKVAERSTQRLEPIKRVDGAARLPVASVA